MEIKPGITTSEGLISVISLIFVVLNLLGVHINNQSEIANLIASAILLIISAVYTVCRTFLKVKALAIAPEMPETTVTTASAL